MPTDLTDEARPLGRTLTPELAVGRVQARAAVEARQVGARVVGAGRECGGGRGRGGRRGGRGVYLFSKVFSRIGFFWIFNKYFI